MLHNLAKDLWIKSLWKFVNRQNTQIKSPKKLIPEKIRIHDKVIINELIRHEFDEVDLVRLNRVRNYLKVLYMSDITKENDKQIKTSIFNGIHDYSTKIKYGWRQEKPAEKVYKIWKTVMNGLVPDRFLPYTLGKLDIKIT